MNEWQKTVLAALDSLGGEANVRSIADRLKMGGAGAKDIWRSLQSLRAQGSVELIAGSDVDSTWRIIEHFGVTEEEQ